MSTKQQTKKDMTKGDQVASVLEQDILSGVLPEGAPVPSQNETAKRFGVSMRTVREAYKVLEAKGLIETSQGRCATVKSVTLPGVWDLLRDKSGVGGKRFERERFQLLLDMERLALERCMLKSEIDGRLTGNELFPIDIPYLLAWHRTLLLSSQNPLMATMAEEGEKAHLKAIERALQKGGPVMMELSKDTVDAVGHHDQIRASALFAVLQEKLLAKAF